MLFLFFLVKLPFCRLCRVQVSFHVIRILLNSSKNKTTLRRIPHAAGLTGSLLLLLLASVKVKTMQQLRHFSRYMTIKQNQASLKSNQYCGKSKIPHGQRKKTFLTTKYRSINDKVISYSLKFQSHWSLSKCHLMNHEDLLETEVCSKLFRRE